MENLLEYRMDWEWDIEQERRRREEAFAFERSQSRVFYKRNDVNLVQILTLYPSKLRVYDLLTSSFFEIPIHSNEQRLAIFNTLGVSFSDFKKNK